MLQKVNGGKRNYSDVPDWLARAKHARSLKIVCEKVCSLRFPPRKSEPVHTCVFFYSNSPALSIRFISLCLKQTILVYCFYFDFRPNLFRPDMIYRPSFADTTMYWVQDDFDVIMSNHIQSGGYVHRSEGPAEQNKFLCPPPPPPHTHSKAKGWTFTFTLEHKQISEKLP